MDEWRYRTYLIALVLSVFVFFYNLMPCVYYSETRGLAKSKTDTNMVFHFIDVGQGDATFVELSDGRTMLIDAGEEEYGSVVVEYISALGYKKIDCLIATHSDSDHVGGLTAVLNAFEVQYIFRPFIIASHANPIDDLCSLGLNNSQILFDDNIAYTKFINAVYTETYGGNPSFVSTLSNKSLCEKFVSVNEPYYLVEVLYPFAEIGKDRFVTPSGKTSGYTFNLPADTNSLSAIIYISTENSKILLMSDGDSSVESELIAKTNTNSTLQSKLSNVDLFKVAHHGSKYSNSREFLSLVSPHISVVSVGAENDYDHPNDETLERLNSTADIIYRTDKDGSIVITIDKAGSISADVGSEDEESKVISEGLMYLMFSLIIVGIISTSIIYTIVKSKKKNEKN